MSKTTGAGSAPSRTNRSLLMHRAWAIFRNTYRYPRIKFSDIGRKCFAWALRRAWAESWRKDAFWASRLSYAMNASRPFKP
jgi:hypothetical protein